MTNSILKAVKADSFLDEAQKAKLSGLLTNPKTLNDLTSGLLKPVIANYMKLSKPAQALLVVAGFGLGRVLWEHSQGKSGKQKFVEFNNRIKAYEIKQ